ncbi:MAG: substrate-binding domain-containing protein [Polyangiaceae bacterium]|jgi:ribose transport system substrate-binding protein|nr:substrate-binding domain-containing protein [Polyangiaceae bacterium]MBK8941459.1 substrate-binding domain-containing protein [Polyangiaceae bacterium]
MRRRELLVGGVGLAGAAACGGKSNKTRIAVIPKGTTHEFWKSVHAGAIKASRELDVEILWKGPLKEDDLKEQIGIVESFVSQGVSGIVLAPLNDKALVQPVKGAKNAKIPTVIFDSSLQGEEHVSYVATDNVAAGRLGGERLAKTLGAKGSVILLRYLEGSASTAQREQGFLEAMKANADLKVVSDNQYGGATTESASTAAETLLVAQGADKGQVAGVFCPNESTTFGMLLALEKLGLAGKVKLVGFDASDKLVAGLKDGKIDGLVLQNPLNMGYLAVKTMVQHLKKESIDKLIDTGARVADKENMDSAELKELLKPDLTPYLGQ